VGLSIASDVSKNGQASRIVASVQDVDYCSSVELSTEARSMWTLFSISSYQKSNYPAPATATRAQIKKVLQGSEYVTVPIRNSGKPCCA